MNPIAVPALVLAGVTFYVGLYHLFIYARTRERPYDRSFAFACFGIVAYDLTCAGLYSATSVEVGVAWQHAQAAALGVSGAAFLWFAADYTGRASPLIVRIVTLYLLLSALFAMVDRSGLVFDASQPAIKEMLLPFGVEVVYYEGSPGPVVIAQTLSGLLIFAYVAVAATLMYRGGRKREAVPLLVALAIFFVGVFSDSAVSSGLYTFPYLIEYSYTSMMLLMGYTLSGELAQAAAVRQRLHESEERLRQARKMESLGTLAGGIAHDFNNLLAPILGYAQLALEDTPKDAPLHDDLVEIVAAARQAVSLTNQLLAVSRKQIAETRIVDLNASVAEFRRVLRHLVREDIEIGFDLTRDKTTLRVDPSQLQQILMNLAVNAGDAMPEGGRLDFTTTVVSIEPKRAVELDISPGRYVCLSVADTGIGIAAENVDRVFEPFFTTKERGRGTGLGLARVHGIATQHGGAIHLVSERGVGTRIEIYLPRVDAEPTEREPDEDVVAATGPQTILVVEDDRAVRQLTVQMLRRNGYTVVAPDTPEDALAIAGDASHAIDLLVTDVIMPRMSGPQLYERLCELRPGSKVLYISGYTGDVMERHGLAAESTSLLQKPFTAAALTRRVHDALNGA